MFHKSNFGSFGSGLPSDMLGYVPEATDGPWDLAIDHGGKATHDGEHRLTEYGQWWEDEGFLEWRDKAIEATAEANAGLTAWREPR